MTRLQKALNRSRYVEGGPRLAVDGYFGPATQEAVEKYQLHKGLYDDGIVGSATWGALRVSFFDPKMKWKSVPADQFKDGYTRFNLREDVAAEYRKVYDHVKSCGGIIPSSGSKRRVAAKVTANRSSRSLHYVGRALDLGVSSGMHHPESDPLVITKDPDYPRTWTVWVRVERGEMMTLNAWVHSAQRAREVRGTFINLTELFAQNGFVPIMWRRSYSRDNYGAAEWWHFQYEKDLPEETTFGEELLKMYSQQFLKGKEIYNKGKHAKWDAARGAFL